MELWRGCIDFKDSALQLFLIVDYICDWARDIYRPAILNELKILASPDTIEIESLFPDSDIISSREVHNNSSNEEQFTQNNEGQHNAKAAFDALDSPHGAVRHARFIQSEFYVLFITSDNVNTLLQSTQEKVLERFSREILGQLKDKSILLESEHLAAIESQWTGATPTASRFSPTEREFYCVITYTFHMTISWEQVREICIIAVAKDAFDALVNASNLQRGRGNTRLPWSEDLDWNLVMTAICDLQRMSVQQNLLAAINRVAGYIDPLSSESSLFCLDDATAWQVIHFVYKSFKKGRLEPAEPFLRFSKRFDVQEFGRSDPKPVPFDEELSLSTSGAVFIYCRGYAYNLGSLCVYLVNDCVDAPSRRELEAAMKETFQNRDVYHTTRDSGSLKLKPTRHTRVPWNLVKTYGVHFSLDGRSFSKWLQSMNADVLTKQGCPRDPAGSGSYLLGREYNPWHDHRLPSCHVHRKVRWRYIEGLVASEYQYWREIAQNREEQGIPSCSSCAKTLNDEQYLIDMCAICRKELTNQRLPWWFGHEIEQGLELRWARRMADLLPKDAPKDTPSNGPVVPLSVPLQIGARKRKRDGSWENCGVSNLTDWSSNGNEDSDDTDRSDYTDEIDNDTDDIDDCAPPSSKKSSTESNVVLSEWEAENSQRVTPTVNSKKQKRV